jgi:phage tail sheath protein FI
MAQGLRRLGVYGSDLPVKRERAITPADFRIGGIIGQFERKFNKTFKVNDPAEVEAIFGSHVYPSFYGWDAVNGFFANARGVDATLYIQSYVGNDGSSIDATTASATLQDDGPNDTLKIEAAFQDEPEYGASGNRTGYQIERGARFSTELNASASSGDTSVTLKSVIGIQVGDVMHFTDSGGSYDEYHKITEIDQSNKTVTWTDASWGATSGSSGDTAEVLGFKIRTYRKTVNGTVQEVEKEIGKIWCTMEPEVTDFYVENVMANNNYLRAIDQDSSSSVGQTRPTEVTTTTFLTGGDDGTAPSGADSWNLLFPNFDNDPIRFLTCPEETSEAVNDAGESYCAGRDEHPMWIYNVPEDQSKAQLIDIGHQYQRSDEVDGVIVANWLKINDPFASSPVAPKRTVPNVGHVMGAWVQIIGTRGIHYVPAVKTNPLRGCTGVVGETFPDDDDRTEIAEAGVNLIQNLQGYGIVIRNFFTPSIDTAYQFANGVLMKEFIKTSVVDALQNAENTPNSLAAIRENRTSVLQFLYRLWENGSTGNAPTGETFGQSEDEDGNLTAPEDHFEVVAGPTNNPQSSINAGERNIDVWFTYPAPAGSIKIGVGILLRS